MRTATNRTRASTDQKHYTRVNMLARSVDRFAEARVQSKYLTFPFAF
jgi:hypothetical protein